MKNHNMICHIDDGSMGGGEPIPHDDYISFGDENQGNNPHPEYLNFEDDFKNGGYFNSERDNVFYYCIFAHYSWAYVFRDGEGWSWRSDRDGISSGNDMLISDNNMDPKIADQGQSFMHELGHRLGLGCPCPNWCAMRHGHEPTDYCSDCWGDIDLTLNIG